MRRTVHYVAFVLPALLLVGCWLHENDGGDLPPAPATVHERESAPESGDAAEATATPLTVPPLPPYDPVPAEGLAALDVESLHEAVFALLLEREPEWAADLGLAEHFQIPNDILTDGSEGYRLETEALERELAELLSARDTATMTADQQLAHELLVWELEDRIAGQPYALHAYPVNQLFGIQNELPSFMAFSHPLTSRDDALAYLARLGAFERRFSDTITLMERQAQLGILPPRFVFDRVLAEMRAFVDTPPAENIMISTFRTRLGEIPELSGPEQEDLVAAAESELTGSVYPAYERLIAAIEHLSAQATEEDGVWKLPEGEAYYAYALRHHTTTEMSADEIHALGLAEVARIQGEINELLAGLGLDPASANAIGQIYRAGGGIQVANEATRAQAFAAYEAAMIEADEKLAPAFNIRPASPLEIQRVPEYRELTAPGAYYTSPALDGSRPGVFYVNLPAGRFVSLVGVPTLAFHEGVPGHHFQLAIQSELAGAPTFQRANTIAAYAEGWALYVERLAWEYGVYDDNVYGNFGRLQSELFRATRLVVDTGIHSKGWTREEAIDYMVEKLGWPEETIAAEVERYIVWPGQATAYKIGELTLLRLREKARGELGEAFDIAEFHTAVLQHGNVPLEILERLVDDYIEEKRP